MEPRQVLVSEIRRAGELWYLKGVKPRNAAPVVRALNHAATVSLSSQSSTKDLSFYDEVFDQATGIQRQREPSTTNERSQSFQHLTYDDDTPLPQLLGLLANSSKAIIEHQQDEIQCLRRIIKELVAEMLTKNSSRGTANQFEGFPNIIEFLGTEKPVSPFRETCPDEVSLHSASSSHLNNTICKDVKSCTETATPPKNSVSSLNHQANDLPKPLERSFNTDMPSESVGFVSQNAKRPFDSPMSNEWKSESLKSMEHESNETLTPSAEDQNKPNSERDPPHYYYYQLQISGESSTKPEDLPVHSWLVDPDNRFAEISVTPSSTRSSEAEKLQAREGRKEVTNLTSGFHDKSNARYRVNRRLQFSPKRNRYIHLEDDEAELVTKHSIDAEATFAFQHTSVTPQSDSNPGFNKDESKEPKSQSPVPRALFSDRYNEEREEPVSSTSSELKSLMNEAETISSFEPPYESLPSFDKHELDESKVLTPMQCLGFSNLCEEEREEEVSSASPEWKSSKKETETTTSFEDACRSYESFQSFEKHESGESLSLTSKQSAESGGISVEQRDEAIGTISTEMAQLKTESEPIASVERASQSYESLPTFDKTESKEPFSLIPVRRAQSSAICEEEREESISSGWAESKSSSIELEATVNHRQSGQPNESLLGFDNRESQECRTLIPFAQSSDLVEGGPSSLVTTRSKLAEDSLESLKPTGQRFESFTTFDEDEAKSLNRNQANDGSREGRDKQVSSCSTRLEALANEAVSFPPTLSWGDWHGHTKRIVNKSQFPLRPDGERQFPFNTADKLKQEGRSFSFEECSSEMVSANYLLQSNGCSRDIHASRMACIRLAKSLNDEYQRLMGSIQRPSAAEEVQHSQNPSKEHLTLGSGLQSKTVCSLYESPHCNSSLGQQFAARPWSLKNAAVENVEPKTGRDLNEQRANSGNTACNKGPSLLNSPKDAYYSDGKTSSTKKNELEPWLESTQFSRKLCFEPHRIAKIESSLAVQLKLRQSRHLSADRGDVQPTTPRRPPTRRRPEAFATPQTTIMFPEDIEMVMFIRECEHSLVTPTIGSYAERISLAGTIKQLDGKSEEGKTADCQTVNVVNSQRTTEILESIGVSNLDPPCPEQYVD